MSPRDSEFAIQFRALLAQIGKNPNKPLCFKNPPKKRRVIQRFSSIQVQFPISMLEPVIVYQYVSSQWLALISPS